MIEIFKIIKEKIEDKYSNIKMSLLLMKNSRNISELIVNDYMKNEED